MVVSTVGYIPAETSKKVSFIVGGKPSSVVITTENGDTIQITDKAREYLMKHYEVQVYGLKVFESERY